MLDSTTWVGMDVHKENIVTVDIAAPRPTAKGKRRNVSEYPLTPVTPYHRSG